MPNSLIFERLAEFYPLWREALLNGEKNTTKKQVSFLGNIFKSIPHAITSVLDLGGGTGTHSIPLSRLGYNLTVFDRSKKALEILERSNKAINIHKGTFETINLKNNFVATICMWSTLNYVLKENQQKKFLTWIGNHTNSVIVLDQPNFPAYEKTLHKVYTASLGNKKIKIIRDWEIKNGGRATYYTYNLKQGGDKKEIVHDVETQTFIPLDKIIKFIGSDWKVKYLLGDYNLNSPFQPKISRRMITVFERCCSNPKNTFHGGTAFNVLGQDFSHLNKAEEIINADVLDAWFKPSPKVINKIKKYLPYIIKTSPPATGNGLLDEISKQRGIPKENITLGAGSSDLMFRLFPNLVQKGDTALLLDPMYGEYEHIFKNVIGCKIYPHVLKKQNEFSINTKVLAADIKNSKSSIAVLVNPNSPTGKYLKKKEIRAILDSLPAKTKLVIDETYIDYVGTNESVEQYVSKYPNLIVIKSLSKIYGLSGVRAAYMIANKDITEKIKLLTPPWNISFVAQVAAIEAIRDHSYYGGKFKETKILRKNFIKDLAGIKDIKLYDSATSYFLLELLNENISASAIIDELRKKSIFLRNCDSMGKNFKDNFIRIAVKSKGQNKKIARELKKTLD